MLTAHITIKDEQDNILLSQNVYENTVVADTQRDDGLEFGLGFIVNRPTQPKKDMRIIDNHEQSSNV